jgi:hypothetical protein
MASSTANFALTPRTKLVQGIPVTATHGSCWSIESAHTGRHVRTGYTRAEARLALKLANKLNREERMAWRANALSLIGVNVQGH